MNVFELVLWDGPAAGALLVRRGPVGGVALASELVDAGNLEARRLSDDEHVRAGRIAGPATPTQHISKCKIALVDLQVMGYNAFTDRGVAQFG